MKKVILIIVLCTTIASCKKVYNCACTYTINGNPTTSLVKTEKLKKKDAKSACEANNGTASAPGLATTTDCKIN